jgi:hypothetical protein
VSAFKEPQVQDCGWAETLGEKRVLKQVLRVSVSFSLVLALASLFSHSVLVVRGADTTPSSIEQADVAVRRAFNATLDAEAAGANVSGLILRLNEAGEALGEAENALRDGDSNAAAGNASLCIGIAESVKSDADVLKALALEKAQMVFWTSLTFSVASVAVFVVVLMLVWRWFKHGYVGKMLGMKPEVTTDEA